LLSPAGSLEKLKHAIVYGADAAYIGCKDLSLRSAADKMSLTDIKKGVDFAHRRGAKVYAALNIFAHNQHFGEIANRVHEVVDAGIDAVIVSDPGIFSVIKTNFPGLPIIVSVQANVTNYHAANFWKRLGAERVTLARELTFSEIKEIVQATDIATEVFVHGAVCIAYSGRCLLSKYLADRDANQGNCAHSCRWKYYLMEEKRPNEFYRIAQDKGSSYILSSKDLCMLEVVPDLISAGVSSLKIEGRMKSLHYVSVVTRIYREAIDRYLQEPASFEVSDEWREELHKVSHREYAKGFILDQADSECPSDYLRNADFVGVVKECDANSSSALIAVRNRIFAGEVLEAFMPTGKSELVQVTDLRNAADNSQLSAAHANFNVYITSRPLPEFSVLRRVKG
jgi:putative protease